MAVSKRNVGLAEWCRHRPGEAIDGLLAGDVDTGKALVPEAGGPGGRSH